MGPERLPGHLEIESREELDLDEIQSKILKHFRKTKKKRIADVNKKIKKLKTDDTTVTVLQKKIREKEILDLEELLEKISDEKDQDDFESRTETVILEFQNVSMEEEKLPLINDFIDVLSDYIQISEIHVSEKRKTTKSSVKKAEEDQKITREIFRKALHEQFSCSPVNLPDKLFEDLDDFFGSFSHLKKYRRKRIHKQKLLENGHRKGTNRKLMHLALKETGNQAFYNRINVICATYWKWEFPSLAEWEDLIMADFDATQKVFREMEKTRQSNLNIQYRLFKHLQARGFPCKKTDFKIISERKILLEYDRMWKYMVENSGIENLVFIKTT